jgi:ribosomal 50S subunit-recycling heat shock protein
MNTKREPVPVDVWLWAARLVQTRAQAVEAIDAGRLHVNGEQVSATAATVKPGDRLELVVGDARIALDVRGVARLRGPQRIAERLYAEADESGEDDADEDTVARRAAVPRVSAGAAGAAAGRTKAGRRAAEDAANSRRVAPRGGGKLGR